MAHINVCCYCNENIINGVWHVECRLAFCEDLLTQIRKHQMNHSADPLPENLRQIIFRETFTSKAERDKQLKLREQRAQQKEFWRDERERHLKTCATEWEKIHPDPDPPQY